VKYAEPNYRYYAFDDGNPEQLPNDTDFSKLWGMNNTGQADSLGQIGIPGVDIGVLPIWQQGVTGSRDIKVAVIDTGVDWTHPDLVENLYTNPGEIAGNGIDDDANGFIDDIHGWNFGSKSPASQDDNDHGSHCAGTIGGVGNNGIGVAGVNWRVSILPVKFIGSDGSGSLDAALEAINYATMMKVNVMSNSWGGGGFSEAMKEAIEKARDANILFVAAAGNDSSDNNAAPMYPASYDVANIISVAAIDNKDRLASFSNWGRTKVHVAAPGVKIFSTTKDGGYNSFSGTSMATPHVSGVAALLLSAFPDMTYAELKDRIVKTAVKVPGLRNKVASNGRVSVFNAFNNIIPPSEDPAESAWQTVDYVVESQHPYENKLDQSTTIEYPGAKYIRVIVERLETEPKYDTLFINNPAGDVIDSVSGSAEQFVSDYVKGDKLVLRFVSDHSVVKWGFRIAKIQVIME
jgi:subtilisin family serine protease